MIVPTNRYKTPEPRFPKFVIDAEKMLRAQYPGLYRRISAFRGITYLDDSEIDFLKRQAQFEHITWPFHAKLILQFCGIDGNINKRPPPEPPRVFRGEAADIHIKRFHRSGHQATLK